MKNHAIAVVALSAVALTTAAFLVGRALATGAPTQSPLVYAGTLTDETGKPYPTAQDVVLAFYDGPAATTPKCPAPLTQAEAGTGRFSVTLGAACVQAFRDNADVWVEATVGKDKKVLPRVHVGAVPYALESDGAKVAGSAGAATGALKGTVEGLVKDVGELKGKPVGGGKVPKVTTLTVPEGFWTPVKYSAGGGLVVVQFHSKFSCSFAGGAQFDSAMLKVDGKFAGSFATSPPSPYSPGFASGIVVVPDLPAGQHDLALVPGVNGLDSNGKCNSTGPANLVVTEY